MKKEKESPKRSFPVGKKQIIPIAAALVGLAVIALVIVIPRCSKPSGVKPNYTPPKYSGEYSDVPGYQPPEIKYEDTVRDIFYTYAGQMTLLTDDNYADQNDAGKFFKEYFDAVKAGDLEAYQSFFAADYFEENDPPEKLTPQKLYDIYVDYHSDSKDVTMGSHTYNVENFTVRFKIFDNDGTFRDDIPSNVSSPQIYQLTRFEDGSYAIVNVIHLINQK